jgi:hypothetical protein
VITGGWAFARFLHQEPLAKRNQCGAVAVCQEPEVANPNESPWQHMQQEAPQKLVGAYGHGPLLIPVGVIFPPERDLAVLESNQSVVGDGNAMRVLSEVMQYMFGSTKGPFCIYDPVLPEELPQETAEGLGIGEASERAMETQTALSEETLQTRHEFSSEYFAEHAYREKEPVRWMDPMRMIGGDAARRNDAVDVRVMLQILSPRVQYAQEADPGSQVLRISGDFDQCFGAYSENKIVENLLVL